MAGDEAEYLLRMVLWRLGRAPYREAAGIAWVSPIWRALMAGQANQPSPSMTFVVLDDVEVIETFRCVESAGDGGLGVPPSAHHVGMVQQLLE